MSPAKTVPAAAPSGAIRNEYSPSQCQKLITVMAPLSRLADIRTNIGASPGGRFNLNFYQDHSRFHAASLGKAIGTLPRLFQDTSKLWLTLHGIRAARPIIVCLNKARALRLADGLYTAAEAHPVRWLEPSAGQLEAICDLDGVNGVPMRGNAARR